MGARRKARELALQMLFQHDMSGNLPDQIIDTFEELQKSKPNTREFATKIFRGTVAHMPELDEMIQNQAENWRLSRMAAVDRNIIRMSVYEFLHESDTPKLVIIDEAIEIAKKYGTQKSSQFINGILDGILKRYNLGADEGRGQKVESCCRSEALAMSLLGRLEDLSLTDIVQIVYLSRRTGVLEIINDTGRHTVLFRGGLVVNAASPEHPDLVTFLHAEGLLTGESVKVVRQMEDSGIPAGTAITELNVLSRDDLANALRQRILIVVTPLLQSKEGEFNFILSDTMGALELEYDPDQIFKEGGFAPNKLLGAGEGEKIKPLKGLEESLKAGKALLRGSAPAETTPASLNLGLGQPIPPPEAPKLPGTAATPTDNVVPFPSRDEFTPIDEPPFPEEESGGPAIPPVPSTEDRRDRLSSTQPPAGSGQFKVAGGLFEVETPEAAFRNVVLFERNPLVRVAARRAFSKQGVKIFQYGSLDDVRSSMTELFRANSFFVTFLELTSDDASVKLMQQLKRKNPRLPVVLIDAEADLRRRHDLLRGGADLYVTKPTPARLQPGLAEEELALFADELVLFAERSFEQWEQLTGGGVEAGKRFYELANKETVDRSFSLLRQLINELSNPNDIGQVSATILRLSAQYLDRGALFMAGDDEFVGLGGFGVTGGGEDMNARVRNIRVARNQPSILSDIVAGGAAHRGKMRRTPANVELIDRLGGLLPTEVVALPIMHSNRAIGILYGDNAEHRAPIDSMTGLEIFLSQAGYAFGNAVFASERAGRR